MKILKSSLILVLLSCSSISHTNKPSSQFDNYRIGIVGCQIHNTQFPENVSQQEIETHIVQNLVDNISKKSKIIVVDRTKLKAILDERALSLSGLIQSEENGLKSNIRDTDYLLLGVITGFTAKIKRLAGDEAMNEFSHMHQAKVEYQIHFELMDSKTSQVEWTYSKKASNAIYDPDKETLDLRKLLFQSLSEHVKYGVEGLLKDDSY